MRYIKAKKKIMAACIGFTAFSNMVCALEISTRGGIFTEYTNNSLRTPTDEVEELEYSIQAGVGLEGASNRYNGKLDYAFTSVYFDRNTFEDRTIVVGSSNLDLVVSPDRFLWQFEHFQDYQEISSRLADVPDNRDERSVIQTGPLFTFDLSPVDQIDLGGRYVETLFDQNSSGESERVVTNLRWLHRYSPIGSVTLIGSYYDVEFKNTDLKYDQVRLGLNFAGQLKNGTYVLEGGQIKIERDTGEETDGYYAVAELDLVYGSNAFNASYNRELTDTSLGLSLSTDFDLDFPSGDSNFDIVDIVESQRLQFDFRRTGVFSNADLGVRAYGEKEDYENRLNDETRLGTIGYASYRFSERVKSELEITYEEVDSDLLAGVNQDKEVELALVYSLNKTLNLRISTFYRQRDNDNEPLQEYESAGALVGLYYNSI